MYFRIIGLLCYGYMNLISIFGEEYIGFTRLPIEAMAQNKKIKDPCTFPLLVMMRDQGYIMHPS